MVKVTECASSKQIENEDRKVLSGAKLRSKPKKKTKMSFDGLNHPFTEVDDSRGDEMRVLNRNGSIKAIRF